MSYRTLLSIAAAAVLGIACASTDALARGGGHAGGAHAGGVHAGGVHAGGVHAGGVHAAGVHRGVGVVHHPAAAVGVGAAVRGGYYGSAACGYYPYPPCQ
jgi:hypothetical protein